MTLDLRDRAGLSPDERARLCALVARLRTLQDVVRMGLAQRPPLVVQDEYTHDVILPAPGERYLVFDTT